MDFVVYSQFHLEHAMQNLKCGAAVDQAAVHVAVNNLVKVVEQVVMLVKRLQFHQANNLHYVQQGQVAAQLMLQDKLDIQVMPVMVG